MKSVEESTKFTKALRIATWTSVFHFLERNPPSFHHFYCPKYHKKSTSKYNNKPNSTSSNTFSNSTTYSGLSSSLLSFSSQTNTFSKVIQKSASIISSQW